MKSRPVNMKSSNIFLIAILLIFLGAAVILIIAMRTDPIKEVLSGEQLLKVLIVLEDEGRPLSTNIIAYYPGSKRAAMFDIPGETGLILRRLGRVDRIDAVYEEKGIQDYKTEIEGLTGISVPFYLVFNLDQFVRLADLLSGFDVFIPTPIDIQTEEGRILLPSGAVKLDGDKIRTYVTYSDPLDQEGEAVGRKQKAVLAFFRALNDNSGIAFSNSIFPVLKSCFRANLGDDSLKVLLEELSKIDSERLVPQRVTGSLRVVDGKTLLFPFYDGQLLKDVIRQTIAGLTSDDNAAQERIYAIEILNGTKTQGLARNTSELYQSFGYDVIRVANAESSEYDKTVVIDRIGNETVAATIAQVIQCKNIQTAAVNPSDAEEYGTETIVDYTIILGKDFTGRFVR
ncbi:LCP family protein [Brucepastera parasyntrophica]|uniref:LCP family protein n=1 Tax=Brucepastera parasyntrophica TaxID=2880008 RepID=UPI0021087521|nr:LCP family protein [Brucepastera parasyntrophica]ULQ60488.1 LCP family protein [Brucepastera parasyntrophica]